MEIQGSDGSKAWLKLYSTTVFGRANQSNTKDLSISRRHISFDIISSPNSPNTQTNPRISFEVLGKNPVAVYSKNGDKKVKFFKRFERGKLGIGDFFCVSTKTPVWFIVKKVEDEAFVDKKEDSLELVGRIDEELSQSLEDNTGFDEDGDFGLDGVDVSNIDPVQEFGFLVIGHEFDRYPPKMIRQIKDCDWFLEEPVRGGSDDEEAGKRKGKKGGKRKRKKATGDDDVDEEWTAESEVEEPTTRPSKAQRPKYHTRSEDPGSSGNKKTNKKVSTSTNSRAEEEYESEDEDKMDETLGGFIVDDETAEEDEEIEEDDNEEEEEFVEDEDELEE